MDQETLDKAIAAKPAPKVTQEIINNNVMGVEYLHPLAKPEVTICVLHMRNGFAVIGKSVPVSRENFDAEIGRELACKDAYSQIWALEGYVLATDLQRGTSADPKAYYANGNNSSNES